MKNELTIIKRNGGAYIDSREVADYIGKRHDNLLRDIDGYVRTLVKSGVLKIEDTSFFIKSTYTDACKREKPRYLLSKLGCALCANKLTGRKGVLFTFAYVKRFNELEAAERDADIESYARPQLSEFNSAVRNVLNGMSQCSTKPSRVMNFLRGVYEPLGIKVHRECDDMRYYSATDIAILLDIYSETGRPHAHAVAAIISKLDNWVAHAITVPYGLVGVTIRYDWSVVESVRKWIADNNEPHDIPHLDFFYHIYYCRQPSLFCNDSAIDLDDEGDYGYGYGFE